MLYTLQHASDSLTDSIANVISVLKISTNLNTMVPFGSLFYYNNSIIKSISKEMSSKLHEKMLKYIF